jgi:hypothetical protein
MDKGRTCREYSQGAVMPYQTHEEENRCFIAVPTIKARHCVGAREARRRVSILRERGYGHIGAQGYVLSEDELKSADKIFGIKKTSPRK